MFDEILTLLRRLSSGTEKDVVLALQQPFTARQLALKLDITSVQSSSLLERLNQIGLVRCLNPFSRASRVYFPTTMGLLFYKELATLAGLPLLLGLPRIDWRLYGSLCFTHRAAVLKTLTCGMQPATIKRKACFNQPNLRMSFNNVCDVIRYLEAQELVEPVYHRKKAHPLYKVTSKGIPYQRLLQQAEVME